MEYRVLTVGREFGSGGAEIARRLATELGWKLLDNALVARIAQAANVDPALARQFDERVDSWLHRVARSGMWSGAFDAVVQPVGLSVFDAETMAELATGLIREAEQEGNCVIVGRGGQCALHSRPGVFHLYVYASRAARIERVRTRQDAPEDLAGWIREMDTMRTQYVRHHFGCEWVNPHLYNLMLDSALGMDAAVNAVLAAMGRPWRAH
jgi:cytidylate kinase